MKNIIHIFGASGSGTSTLGRKISKELGYKFMDTDDYFWLPTDPKYTQKRPTEERLWLMKKDIEEAENVVISGSLTDWGDELIPLFTLAIRLVVDVDLRIERLRKREREMYGRRIDEGGDMYEIHQKFLSWARAYDTGSIEMRSKAKHDEWQKLLTCELLVLNGADRVEDNFSKVIRKDKSRKVLVTGGTVFVSRYVAEYYVKKGYDVYVLNRNNREQCEGVTLIEADRKKLGDVLKAHHFDVVFDVTAYTGEDVNLLLDALGSFEDYVLISSSAVYPEYEVQPFTEESKVAANKFWGKYGTDKIDAEEALMKRVPGAYILRPPYLYGSMNNVYREAFVFECAMRERKFYLPKDGGMKLQFFHVEDLCRFMDIILEKKPAQHIFNVGNKEAVSIKEWVSLCYQVANKEPEFVYVYEDIPQRSYFSFYDYEYYLDVQRQGKLMPETKSLKEGLEEAYTWYKENADKVVKKPLIQFIDENLKK